MAKPLRLSLIACLLDRLGIRTVRQATTGRRKWMRRTTLPYHGTSKDGSRHVGSFAWAMHVWGFRAQASQGPSCANIPIFLGESVFEFVAKPFPLAVKGGRGSAWKSRGFPPIGNPIWRYIPKGPFDGGSACGVVWKRRDLPARTILLVDPFGGIEQKADFANCCSPFANQSAWQL